jgi:hypothetical protein
MLGLSDRPNLQIDELKNMLLLAMPSFIYTGGFEWLLETGDFIKYHPEALPQHRWQIKEILLDCDNFRYTRKDGLYGRKTKRISKRFPSLVEAILYYEKEIKK